jgi:AraC-like DNA-binding protein
VPTIHRHYFEVCTRGAERKGVPIPALLQAAGLGPALPEDQRWRGSIESMARLVRRIREVLDDEFMGFTPHATPRGAFAFAAELASKAGSVEDGLIVAARFYNLVNPDIATTIESRVGECVVTVRFTVPGFDPEHYFCEFWLMTWHRLACWLSREPVPLLGAAFDYRRPDAYFEEFRHLFPCPHHFEDGVLRIHLDARALKRPVARTSAELGAMIEAAPLDLMTIPSTDRSLQQRIRSLLVPDPAFASEEIAARIGLSVDALRRRLQHEGTTLSAIRESVRRDAAIFGLLKSNRSIEALAASLGYQEARSFTRAFRTWTGLSPSEWTRRYGHA